MDVTEGSITVSVPEQPDAGVGDAVFYNPEQELNRDLTIATLRAYAERAGRDADSENLRYLDATAATGIRGVRAAADGWTVTCCDRDAEAVSLSRENLARNDLAGDVCHRDANALMYDERFDVIDLDPFGTPTRFIDSAVRSATGLLCVTATDTAPLCGAHFHSGVRKYGCVPRNTDFHAEMGLRVLLSALCRNGARYDRALTPMFSHATRHYVRVYLDVENGASAANGVLEELGYVHWCPDCLFRTTEPGLIAHPPSDCPHCGGALTSAGPIFCGPSSDSSFVGRVRDHLSADMGTRKRAARLLDTIEGELDTPTHYDQHDLCHRWGRSANAIGAFITDLRAAGFEASRTHYGGTTVKTTADVEEMEAAAAPEE